jgi:hypothetical protein
MIRKIENKPMSIHRHHSDVERLQRVMLQNGYEADYDSAAGIWEDYSDDYAAGWLGMPEEDDELWQRIEDRVEREAQ